MTNTTHKPQTTDTADTHKATRARRIKLSYLNYQKKISCYEQRQRHALRMAMEADSLLEKEKYQSVADYALEDITRLKDEFNTSHYINTTVLA